MAALDELVREFGSRDAEFARQFYQDALKFADGNYEPNDLGSVGEDAAYRRTMPSAPDALLAVWTEYSRNAHIEDDKKIFSALQEALGIKEKSVRFFRAYDRVDKSPILGGVWRIFPEKADDLYLVIGVSLEGNGLKHSDIIKGDVDAYIVTLEKEWYIEGKCNEDSEIIGWRYLKKASHRMHPEVDLSKQIAFEDFGKLLWEAYSKLWNKQEFSGWSALWENNMKHIG